MRRFSQPAPKKEKAAASKYTHTKTKTDPFTMKSIFLIPVFFLTFLSLTVGQVNTVSTSNNNSNEPTFQEFLAQFPKASLPYTFDVEALQSQLESRSTAPKAKRLGWDYYQFLPMLEESARYNRMPVYPEPVAAFETAEYYAVLYNTGRAFTKNFKSYHITVFDKNGKHLATNFVAGVNPGTLTAATIELNLQASVQAYQINWAIDFQENGQEGNSINSMTPAGRQTLNLTSGGMVEQVNWSSKPGNLSAAVNSVSK